MTNKTLNESGTMTFLNAVEILENRGYQASAGSFEDNQQIYVFSKSIAKNCYGHSAMSLQYFKGKDYYTIGGKKVSL